MITADDLHPDPVLLRRVKRIEELENHEHSSDDEGGDDPIRPGTQRRYAEEIDGDSGGDDAPGTDRKRKPSLAPHVKPERLTSTAPDVPDQGQREISVIPGTQMVTENGAMVVDLGEEEGDDAE